MPGRARPPSPGSLRSAQLGLATISCLRSPPLAPATLSIGEYERSSDGGWRTTSAFGQRMYDNVANWPRIGPAAYRTTTQEDGLRGEANSQVDGHLITSLQVVESSREHRLRPQHRRRDQRHRPPRPVGRRGRRCRSATSICRRSDAQAEAIPLTQPSIDRRLVFVWPETHLSPAGRAFVDLAEQEYEPASRPRVPEARRPKHLQSAHDPHARERRTRPGGP
jgi:hypothetical protein